MDLIELIIFIVIAIIFAALSFLVIKLALKNRNLEVRAIQAELDRIRTMVQLEKIQGSNEVEKTDGFLKFVSDSRDWAFQYIEDVQAAIDEYKKVAETVPINKEITVEQAEKLSKAYEKLINFLP